MRVLFITPDLKWPLSFGGNIRKWNILQGLLAAGPVDVLACGADDLALSEKSYEGCDKVVQIPSIYFNQTPRQKRLYDSTMGRGFLAVSNVVPYGFLWGNRVMARGLLRSSFRAEGYSLIWVETLRYGIALDVPGFAGPVNTVLDGDDFAWVRDRDVLRASPRYGAMIFNYLDSLKTWYWETTCTKSYSRVIRCSVEDAQRQNASNVLVVPNGTVVPEYVRRSPEKKLVFVGVLWYEPNSVGVEWFLSNVWPSVLQQVPSATFDIIGKGPSDKLLNANGKLGVAVHGYVDDIEPFYESAALAVVPLQAGGGTRLKILESLGRGVPVVSTSIGAYGIPLGESQGLIRQDSARGFAEACVNLLGSKADEAQRAALKGREAVIEKFQWRTVQKTVAEIASTMSSACGNGGSRV